MPPKNPPPLPEEFLAAEFEYIANSAFQANEDRSKAASFFLVSVGSLVAAIFGVQLNGSPAQLLIAYRSLAGLFLVVTLLGWLTMLQLSRLRLAWYDAADAMNKMKEFYIARNNDLADAFLWKAGSLPKKFKINSISFFITVEVALMSALTFGAFVYFSMMSGNYIIGLWPISLSVAALAFIAQLLFYRGTLQEKRKP